MCCDFDDQIRLSHYARFTGFKPGKENKHIDVFVMRLLCSLYHGWLLGMYLVVSSTQVLQVPEVPWLH